MQFYQSMSCFSTRPTEPVRFLIARNLDQLVKLSISEVSEFQNTNQTKSKALDQLKYTLLIGEDRITKHTQTILKSLVKVWHGIDDIPQASKKIHQIVEVIGYFVKSSYYIPLVISILGQEEFKNSNKNTIILLNILGHMLVRSEDIEDHVDSVIGTLSSYESQFYQNDQGLVALFDIAHTLLKRLNQIGQRFLDIVFQVFVNVQATKTIAELKRKQSCEAMLLLATKSNFASVADLHAALVGPILERMIKNKQYVNWNKTSKNRFKFDTIVRNCSSEVSRFLQEILQVFEFMINPQSDVEVRMDTLVLIQFVISQPQLKESLAPLSEQFLKKVLLVSIQWKVGKPQIKIRKAGMINMITLVDRSIINQDQLLDSFKDLIPHLKNCLNDDWAPELRLASCEFLEKFLLATKQKIGDDELRELYPMLLERLDDSQDAIRLKITAAINVFFSCRYIKLSQSTFEYMISAIFIHFDDSSEEIQSAIHVSLRHAAIVNPKMVCKQAEVNLQRMKHKEKCSELIEYCHERIEEFS